MSGHRCSPEPPDVIYPEDVVPEQLELPFQKEGQYDCRNYSISASPSGNATRGDNETVAVPSPGAARAEAQNERLGATLGACDWRAEEGLIKHMNRYDVRMLHEALCSEARDIMRAKNHDYASEADPFRNFRRHGALGIIVRLSDKIARLESFTENGRLEVGNESMRDTILDIINYAVLFQGYLIDSNAKNV